MPESTDDLDPAPTQAFARDLRALYEAVEVPAAVDDAVLRDAAAYLAAQRHRSSRRRMRLGWIGAGAAAAAIVAVTLLVYRSDAPIRPQLAVTSAPAAAIAGDLNSDGHVDVLDVLVLAHRLQAHTAVAPVDDFN